MLKIVVAIAVVAILLRLLWRKQWNDFLQAEKLRLQRLFVFVRSGKPYEHLDPVRRWSPMPLMMLSLFLFVVNGECTRFQHFKKVAAAREKDKAGKAAMPAKAVAPAAAPVVPAKPAPAKPKRRTYTEPPLAPRVKSSSSSSKSEPASKAAPGSPSKARSRRPSSAPP